MSNELAVQSNSSMLSSENFDHWAKVSKLMASSDMVPKGYKGKPQDILLAMEYGTSLGMTPLAAVQNIAVISGRPSLWGDAVLAVCSGHKDFENIIEEPILAADNSVEGYQCTIKRKGRRDVTQPFTITDAKKAGLWGKSGPWSQYPARMLQMRARAFALRDSFADALLGVSIREEVQDYIDGDVYPSRTSELKKELLFKKRDDDKDDKLDKDHLVQAEDIQDTEAEKEGEDRPRMEELGDSGAGTGAKTDSITSEQKNKIEEMLELKGFTDERKAKAFSYYDVSSLDEFTPELAEHFISQLGNV